MLSVMAPGNDISQRAPLERTWCCALKLAEEVAPPIRARCCWRLVLVSVCVSRANEASFQIAISSLWASAFISHHCYLTLAQAKRNSYLAANDCFKYVVKTKKLFPPLFLWFHGPEQRWRLSALCTKKRPPTFLLFFLFFFSFVFTQLQESFFSLTHSCFFSFMPRNQ